MTRFTAGRIVLSSDAPELRRYAAANLTTAHSRTKRLLALARLPIFHAQAMDGDPTVSEIAGVEGLEGLVPSLRPDHEACDWILLRDYDDIQRDRSTLFLFMPEAAAPHGVVKMRASFGSGPTLNDEARVLELLSEKLPLEFSPMLPRVVRFETASNSEVLVESALEGVPLWIAMQRSARPLSSLERTFAGVGRWLGAFQRGTRGAGAFLEDVPPTSPDGAEPLIASVAVHGDFWARNILIRDGRVSGVVDWEAARISGPPWQDPFDFALHLAAGAPAWRQRSATDRIRDALFGRGPSARALRAFFTAWRTGARLDREMLPRFLDLYLEDAALRGGKEKSGEWRSSIPWTSIRAEAARRDLFVFSG